MDPKPAKAPAPGIAGTPPGIPEVAMAVGSDPSVGAADTRLASEVEEARVARRMEELVGTRMMRVGVGMKNERYKA